MSMGWLEIDFIFDRISSSFRNVSVSCPSMVRGYIAWIHCACVKCAPECDVITHTVFLPGTVPLFVYAVHTSYTKPTQTGTQAHIAMPFFLSLYRCRRYKYCIYVHIYLRTKELYHSYNAYYVYELYYTNHAYNAAAMPCRRTRTEALFACDDPELTHPPIQTGHEIDCLDFPPTTTTASKIPHDHCIGSTELGM